MTAPITPDERAAMRDTAHFTKATVGLYGQATPTQVEVDYADAVLRLLDALDTAEAEVTQLRATTSPVWDEDAVTLAVFERSHEPSFEDSEEGMREAKAFVRSLLAHEHLRRP